MPEGSDWGRRINPAFEELRHVPPGAGAQIRKQNHLDWKQWGRKQAFEVALTIAGETFAVAASEQLAQAAFHHPIGWLVALQASVVFGDSAHPDTVVLSAEVTAGLGTTSYVGDYLVGTIGPATPRNLVLQVGPLPAETLFVRMGFGVTAAAAGTFPRKTTVVVGAFVAPQVWP